MRICIAGKNDVAVLCTEYLLNDLEVPKENIIIVPVVNDDGEDGWQRSLKKYAAQEQLILRSLADVYGMEDMVFISLQFDKIIDPSRFVTDKLFNLHFAPLPKYKGMHTSSWPLINGEEESGVTFHVMDDGIDTGDIIFQEFFEIGINDTARDLYEKYKNNGVKLFKDSIGAILSVDFKARPQPCEFGSYYSKESLSFNDCKIDFNKTSFEIHNQIRAFIFPGFQLPEICGKNIIKSMLTGDKIEKNTISDKGNEIHISGVDGYLIKAVINDD